VVCGAASGSPPPGSVDVLRRRVVRPAALLRRGRSLGGRGFGGRGLRGRGLAHCDVDRCGVGRCGVGRCGVGRCGVGRCILGRCILGGRELLLGTRGRLVGGLEGRGAGGAGTGIRGRCAVQLDLVEQLRGDLVEVAADLVVEVLVVDDAAFELRTEVVADHLHDQRRFLVDRRQRLGIGGRLFDPRPLGEQPLDVGGDLLLGRALGCGADDDAVLGRLDLLHDPTEPVSLAVGELAGDAEQVGVRGEHHVAAGEREVHRQPGTLGAHRILGDLHEHLLAGLERVLDALRLALLEVQLVVEHLAGVEHAVAALPDVEERRFHPRQHVLDPRHVDVADEGHVLLAGDVVLDDGAVLQHRDLGAVLA
jgi:hypothetical protein